MRSYTALNAQRPYYNAIYPKLFNMNKPDLRVTKHAQVHKIYDYARLAHNFLSYPSYILQLAKT